MTLTIRQRWLNVKARHTGSQHGKWCHRCGESHPCPDYEDAVAALKALDEAETNLYRLSGLPRVRLVPDPVDSGVG